MYRERPIERESEVPLYRRFILCYPSDTPILICAFDSSDTLVQVLFSSSSSLLLSSLELSDSKVYEP
jgi:hypothetical protein